MRVVREYCCCAIPLYNSGIYLTLLTNLIIGLTVGILSVATPSIVGASTPAFTKWVLAIVCFVAAGIQVLGILGVMQEKTILYRRFTTLHCMVTIGAFAVAAVWIGWSGGKHNAAQTRCQTDFFANATVTAGSPLDITKEGQILCNIFAWATFGIMIGLWVILGILEFYLYLVISGYGSSQRDDHARYFSLYSVNDGPGPNQTFLGNRDAWDSNRLSMDDVQVGAMGHQRTDSDLTEKGYADYRKPAYQNPSPFPQRSNTMQTQTTRRQMSGDNGYPSHPLNAWTMDPGPTPSAQQTYGYNANGYSPYPASQPHPGQ